MVDSTQLKSQHPNVYKDFFATHDVVVSSCFGFNRVSTALGHQSDFINIRQKIPLRCYAGSKEVGIPGISIGSIKVYGLEGSFELIDVSKVIPAVEARQSECSALANEYGLTKGYRIDLLIESTRGHGLGFSGTIAACTVSLIALLAGKLGSKDLENYNKFQSSELWQQLANIAWKLEQHNKNNNSLGLASRVALSADIGPRIAMSTKRDSLGNLLETGRHVTTIQQLHPDELLGDLQLDYCLIFSGLLNNTQQVERLKKADHKHLEQIRDYMKMHFSQISSPLIDQIQESSLYDTMISSYGVLSMKMLYLLSQLMEYGDYPEIVDKMITHANDMRHFIRMIERSDGFAGYLSDIFHGYASHADERIGIIPLHSGKHGGNYLLIMRRGYSRKTLARTVESLQKIYQDTHIHYSSRDEQTQLPGIQILQDVVHDSFSEYIDRQHVVYIDNQGQKLIDTYENLLKQCPDGILMDGIAGKIFIKGQKVTSAQLKSQSTTVEVFEHLLSNIGKAVSSSKLGSSSYTNQYNQMQGKILGPLVRLVQESFGVSLPLSAKSSYGSYTVTLDQTDLPIGLIKTR